MMQPYREILVSMDWSTLWAEFTNGDADAVTALGTWATVAVAIMAAAFVIVQIRDGRRVALETSQPSVTIFMESNAAEPQFVELAVKNFGPSAARDIRIVATPTFRRTTNGVVEPVWLPPVIPYLAPGQEWRTTWDFGPRRMTSDLADENRHEVLVTYLGLKRTERTSRAVLDWSAFTGRRFLERKTVHHGAKALQGLYTLAQKWTENGRYLRVAVRDADAWDAEERAEIEQMREEARRAREQAPNDEPDETEHSDGDRDPN